METMKENRLHSLFMELAEGNAEYLETVCACFYPCDVRRQEEMMQAVTVQLLDVLEAWMERERCPMPHPYFRTVFQNLCKRYHRQQQEHQQHHVPLDKRADAILPDDTPSLYARLDELLDQLNDRDREVIELYCRSGDSATFASRMGVSPGYARVILHRIVTKLRSLKALMDKENES